MKEPGDTVEDASGNGNTGTIVNATWSTSGKYQGALYFDGSGDYMNGGTDASLDLGSDFTISAWIYPTSLRSLTGVVSKVPSNRSGTQSFMLVSHSDKGLSAWGDNVWEYSGNIGVTVNSWHYVTWVYKGEMIYYYVDGQLRGSDLFTYTDNGSHHIFVGSWTTNTSNDFTGYIDEVIIYDRVLGDKEIEEAYLKYGPELTSVIAVDTSASTNGAIDGDGLQAGDQVVITFNTSTNAPTIDASNIETVLALDNDHSWLDGSDNIGSAVWSTTDNTDDTLTITLSTTTSAPTVALMDTVTLDLVTIITKYGDPIDSSCIIRGTFDSIPSGAIAYWRFNEGTGDKAYDLTPDPANDGTRYSATWTTEGKVGNALDFGGTADQYYVSADSNIHGVVDGLTVEAWVYRTASGAYQGIVDKYSNGSNVREYLLRIENDNNLNFWVGYNNGNSAYALDSGLTVPLNEWAHVVATWDGTYVRIYVNSVKRTSSAQSINHSNNEPGNLQIGRYSTSGNAFSGKIDEVVIYNRALSDEEINKRYGAKFVTALATDEAAAQNGDITKDGIQAGDKVTITLDGQTLGPEINNTNIDSVLALSGSCTTCTWLDGSGNIDSAVWTTTTYSNDTLTVTLSTTDGLPDINTFDAAITLDGSYIKDGLYRPIVDTVTVRGSFDNIPSGAVAYWRFNEGTGTKAYDLTPNPNSDGTINSATWTTDGRLGNALDFGGTADQFYVLADGNIHGAVDGLTLEAWVYRTTSSTTQSIIDKWYTNNYLSREYLWRIESNNLLYFWIGYNNGNSERNMNSGSTTVPTNEWVHVAATWDGTVMRLYINGDEANNYTPPAMAHSNDRPTSVQIGRYQNGSCLFPGKIDEVVIYNRALSDAEIKERYGASLAAAKAFDSSNGGDGIQAGDQVVVTFDGETLGPVIDYTNIDTVLALSGNCTTCTWLDGSGNIGSAVWSDTTYTNDTLTVTLSTDDGAPDIYEIDTITLDASTIKDVLNRSIIDDVTIRGTFDTVPTGAVAYWRINEGSANKAYDSTIDHKNDGTITGATWTVGEYGDVLDFDGADDFINCGTDSSLDLGGEFTVSAWIKPETLKNNAGVVSKVISNRSGTYSYMLVCDGDDGRLGAYGNNVWVYSNVGISTGNWYHVAWVLKDGDITFYIDGQPQGTSTFSYTDTTGHYVFIGSWHTSDIYDFDGLIDEVIIYNYGLNGTEIQDLYAGFTLPFAPVNGDVTPEVPALSGKVSLTPTLSASALSDPGADGHQSSHWQIKKGGGNYGDGDSYDSGAISDLSNHAVDAVFAPETLYYWQVRYQDNRSIWSEWSEETTFKTRDNTAPHVPTAISPNDETLAGTVPLLISSDYSDDDVAAYPVEIHRASQWQVAEDENFSSIVHDSGITDYLTVYSPSITLNTSTPYYWRVQHQDWGKTWSGWSNEASFATGSNVSPDKPENVLPTDGYSGFERSPVLSASVFSDPEDRYNWLAAVSQWQISTVSNFADITYDSRPITDGTSHTVAATLGADILYYWRVRYQDSNDAWSSYSEDTVFGVISPSCGNCLDVCSSGCSYSTIQAAINDAGTGDTVRVYTGIYNETIEIDKEITVTAVGDVTIDGNGEVNVVEILKNSGSAVLDGFTITNGGGIYLSGLISEGGQTFNVITPTISNCLISNMYNKGLYVDYVAYPRIVNCTIVDNEMGVYTQKGGNPYIFNSVIWGNTSAQIHVDSNNRTWSGPDNGVGRLSIAHSLVDGGCSGITVEAGASLDECSEGDVYSDDPSFDIGGYRLQSDSPAIDTGALSHAFNYDYYGDVTTTAPSSDINDYTRPVDGPDADSDAEYDIGVYEYGSAVEYDSVPPNRPDNVSVTPEVDSGRISLTLTLHASDFTDDDGDGQGGSRWQIRKTDGAYGDGDSYDSGAVADLTSHALASSLTTAQASYYWRVQYQNSTGAWSIWSDDTNASFTTRTNTKPVTPAAVSPKDETTAGNTPTLISSEFSDTDNASDPDGEFHTASQWQIRKVGYYYADETQAADQYDSGVTTVYLTGYAIPLPLTVNTQYYWHIRHQDVVGAWSEWSDYSVETSFFTSTTASPDRPVNVSPDNGDTVSRSPTLTASAFSDAEDEYSWPDEVSQWQISAVSNFADIAYDSGPVADGTGHTVAAALDAETLCYWHVRYRNSEGVWSPYSDKTSFTTLNAGLAGWDYKWPLMISNTNTSTLYDYQVKITLSDDNPVDLQLFQANGEDVRFTESDGKTQISFWIESWSATSATIWVRVPSLPNGDTTIYLYGGNDSANDASDPDATFDVFDNFDDNSINGSIWSTHVRNGGAISETDGEMKHVNDSNHSGSNHYTQKTFIKTDQLAIDFWIRYPSAYSSGGNNHGVYFFNTSEVTWTGTHYDAPGNAANIGITGGISVIYDTQWRITLNGDGTYSLTRLAGNQYISDRTNQAISNWASISEPFVIDFYSGTYGYRDTHWDDIIIRKYADPQPSVTNTGNAEMNTGNAPDQPGNVSPVDESGLSLIPTLSASGFFDPDTGDIHAASRWQIRSFVGSYGDTQSYDSGVVFDLIDHTLALDDVLVSETIYYWRVQYQDDTNAWSLYSNETPFTTRTNTAPDLPTGLDPDNEIDVYLPPLLSASNFSDADETIDPGTEFHSASQWQITTTKGDYTDPAELYDYTTTVQSELTDYTIPATLTTNTQYFWHVQYQDAVGDWSGYSTEASFTTSLNTSPDKPVNVSPDNGDTVSRSPTLTASAFSDVEDGYSWPDEVSQWQISTVSNFADIAYDSGPVADGTGHTVSATLAPKTVYYWHARYQDSVGTWSNYSYERSFTTEAASLPLLGWEYRWPITINNSGSTLTDYQVDITLTDDSPVDLQLFQANGEDVRFTESDRVTLIDFWIESWSATTATLWVKVSSLPTGDTTIYLYGGNASASDAGDGNAIFEFFDDFSTDTSGNYGHQSSGAVGTFVQNVSSGVFQTGRPTGNGGSFGRDTFYQSLSLNGSYTLRVNVDSFMNGYGGNRIGISTNASPPGSWANKDDFVDDQYYSPSSGTGVFDIDYTSTLNGTHYLVIFTYDAGVQNIDIKTDYLFISKYAISQPGVTGIGTTQEGIAPERPENVSPAVPNNTDISLTPTLSADSFTDPEGDSHAASRWQIRSFVGSYGDTQSYDSGVVFDLTNHTLVLDDVLVSETIYYWRVQYQDDTNAWSLYSNETTFTTRTNTAPDPPTGLDPDRAIDIALSPTLSASAISDVTDEAADSNGEFHRASQWQITTDKGNYTDPTELYTYTTYSPDLTGYTIPAALTTNTQYWWYVQYQDAGGDWSGYSTEASFTTIAAPPPAAPGGLSAEVVSDTRIDLSWTDNSDDENGFKIERKEGSGGTWSLIDTVETDVITYQDITGLNANTTYYYRVRAYNAAGDSGYSNEANAATLHSGVVAYWKFDENTGITAADSVGGNDGSLEGDPTWTADSKSGYALSFAGVNYVENSTPTLGIGSGSFTMEMWVYPTSDAGRQITMYFGQNATNAAVYFEWDRTDKKFNIQWYGGAGTVYSNNTYSLNQWYHVVGVYNGSTVSLYVNGVSAATPVSYSSSNIVDDYINISGYSGGLYFTGSIDEVVIYDSALTCAEIKVRCEAFGDTCASCP